MKINWGTGIFIFYVIFVLTLLTVLIASFSVDRSLVVDKYYNEDLNYQKHLTKKINTKNSNKLKIIKSTDSQNIILEFDAKKTLEGKVQLYRPSNKSMDRIIDIKGKQMTIDYKELSSGKWVIKVDWKADNIEYYQEETFFI